MEFVDGEDLRTILRREGKFSAKDAIAMMEQVCRALDCAHSEGVIHRDLKPQNIMRDKHGRIVVMDFGLARSLGDSGMTQTGAIVGTMEYMSPEQAMGSTLDQRSDIFSVGLIFFELLPGSARRAPNTFRGRTLAAIDNLGSESEHQRRNALPDDSASDHPPIALQPR